MKLSVIIPVFNEKGTVRQVLDELARIDLPKEIIIVDDASTDGTREILKQRAESREQRAEVKVIFHEKNIGKGAAVRTAIPQITGDVVIIQDADLEYDPREYHKLLAPIMAGKAEVVYGSRFLKREKICYSHLHYFAGNILLTSLTNLLYRSKLTDEYTCYKVFKTEVLKSLDLKCKRFEFEAEITVKVLKAGLKIYEVPISYHPRSVKQGKKINWQDALRGLWTIFKYRF